MAACRACRAELGLTLVDLGEMPLANSNLRDAAEAAAEKRFPLRAMVCETCWLVQLDHVAEAAEIFGGQYDYLSSYSTSWVAHAERYVEAMVARFGLGPESLIAEVASNDGYLLQHGVVRGIPVLGIEPAENAARAAEARGVPTRRVFFGADTAAGIAAEGRRADLIAANNVLAHVPDLHGFVAGFPLLLAPEGVATFEFPHLLRLLEGVQFDTIYHEHYSYLSLLALEPVLAKAGLRVFDVEELPTHGGSLRLYACHGRAGHAETPAVIRLRSDEAEAGLVDAAAYSGFADRVAAVRRAFRAFLDNARGSGKRIAAYGAAAKGNTFLNFCRVTADELACVADRNPDKQGKLLPGTHLPIVAPETLLGLKPDLVMILPWNLRAEIMAQMAAIRAHGGRFVVVEGWSANPVVIL